MAERRRFRHAVAEMLDSWLWEQDNHRMNRIPDPVDYVEMRRRTFGSDLTMSLSRISRLQDLPEAVQRSRPVRSMENSAMDCACLINDMFSYRKEIELEGEVHNAVLVVRDFLGCTQERAFEVVNDLLTSRMRQFEHVVEQELPALVTDHSLDRRVRRALASYVQDLKDWLAGIHHWHANCRRYQQVDVAPPRPRVGALSGLGMSAARVLSPH
jgi:germacradienol/geosmin synthase